MNRYDPLFHDPFLTNIPRSSAAFVEQAAKTTGAPVHLGLAQAGYDGVGVYTKDRGADLSPFWAEYERLKQEDTP